MNNTYRAEQLSPLYEAVQSSGIFEDSKYFTDCIPRYTSEHILAAYLSERDAAAFDLNEFVQRHFVAPVTPQTGYSSEGKSIEQHLSALWELLTRSDAQEDVSGTLIALPHPYIVPGGRFREIYYWDSYFTLLGLREAGKTALMRHMTDNFAWLLREIGFIPNGNRTYYLSRSQPPFFALMVALVCDDDPEAMASYLGALETEYRFWTENNVVLTENTPAKGHAVRLSGGVVMQRYWDHQPEPRPEAWKEDAHLAVEASPRSAASLWRDLRAAAESGWDFSSRWMSDEHRFDTIQTTQLLPVDLNCLMWNLENTLARLYDHQRNAATAAEYTQKADQRAAAIQRYHWSDSDGFFFDYDLEKEQTSGKWALSGVFPLFFGLATPEQARRAAEHIASRFLKPGGVATTLVHSGQQWDAPNGWAPLQWITFAGLRRYGHIALATTLAQRWTALNENVYAATGKMMEKYNVEDISLSAGGGEYPNQDGFGWTNGVYLAMKAALGAEGKEC